MPEEYEAWVDAQIFSEKASSQYASFKDMVYPLEKTKNRKYLDEMWTQIDKVSVFPAYQELCPILIDTFVLELHLGIWTGYQQSVAS